MESSKLKNIVLLILAVTNLFLLLLMVSQRLESRQLQRQTLSDAVTLLEERGIEVNPDILDTRDFPPLCQVERSTDGELAMFTRLLGEGTSSNQRGLITFYTGPLGQAEVRGDGAFSVTLEPGAYPLAEKGDPAGDILAFLARRMGFGGEVSASGAGSLTMTQFHAISPTVSYPVFSCTVTVTYDGGAIVSISGARFMDATTALDQGDAPLSLATLLVRFRGGLIAGGDTCTALLNATQGYILSADGATLTPVLRLETDTGLYYLNAMTGEFFQI